MLGVIGRRIAISIPLLFVVSIIVFVLQTFLPGDAAVALAGSTASAEQIQRLREELHLDQPMIVQYSAWLGQVASGSLGRSPINGEPVLTALNTRLPVTVALVTLATLVSTVLGLAFGVISSRGGRLARRMSDIFSISGLAVPPFWAALVLISVFAVSLRWFPTGGYVRFGASPTNWAWALALPVFALSLRGVTIIAKQSREALIDAGSRDFVRSLRGNGISERSILFKHILRSAAIPVITVSGLLFISSLGSAVVIEQIFGLPGLGSLAIISTTNHDIPMIQGVAVYFALLVVAVNLVLDLLYAWLNPKVRT